MTAPDEYIESASACFRRLIELADDPLGTVIPALHGEQPWERPDLYALASLAAATEAAEGIVAALDAGRVQNAGRLSRHLFEFGIEMAWILDDPATRLPVRHAEDARMTLERLDEATRDHALEDMGLDPAFLETLAELLREERERLGRGSDAGVMPGYGAMAAEIGRRADYDAGYGPMSVTSKPGLSSAGRHVVMTPDGIAFEKVPRDIHPSFFMGPLCNGANSFGICLGLTFDAIGVTRPPELLRVTESCGRTCAGWEESLLGRAPDARQ